MGYSSLALTDLEISHTKKYYSIGAFSHDVTAAICTKARERRPYWCTRLTFWKLNSIFMVILTFVSLNQYSRWSREWKLCIYTYRSSRIHLWRWGHAPGGYKPIADTCGVLATKITSHAFNYVILIRKTHDWIICYPENVPGYLLLKDTNILGDKHRALSLS